MNDEFNLNILYEYMMYDDNDNDIINDNDIMIWIWINEWMNGSYDDIYIINHIIYIW